MAMAKAACMRPDTTMTQRKPYLSHGFCFWQPEKICVYNITYTPIHRHMYIYIHACSCSYIYICTYIYIHTPTRAYQTHKKTYFHSQGQNTDHGSTYAYSSPCARLQGAVGHQPPVLGVVLANCIVPGAVRTRAVYALGLEGVAFGPKVEASIHFGVRLWGR